MAERALLLGLMRRLRRRRRWSDATTGAAFAVSVCAPAIAAAIPLLRWRGVEPAVAGVAVVLAAGALAGALVRALRRISLPACARAVDRALAPLKADDRVFAAVSFAESGGLASPFVAAVTADAWARARALPARRIVPGPATRAFVLAGVGVIAVATLLVSRAASPASTGPTGTTAADPARDVERHRTRTAAAPLRMAAAALDAEREDVAAARAAARAAADAELARLADEMARLLAELSGAGVNSESAVKRARALASEAQRSATDARVAEAAAKASRAALATGRGGGTSGAATALAKAIGTGEAADAAARLAADGAGPSALAHAAAAAAAVLDRAAAGGANAHASADSDGGGQPRDDETSTRRLDDGSAPKAGDAPAAPAGGGPNQRQLQKLRRDLDRSAADCRRDPEACRRNARGTGRALDQLGRAGQTADARTRLAQSAQQLLDRLQRGGGGGGEARRMRSFSRAARTGAVSPPVGAPGVARPESGVSSGTGAAAGEASESAMNLDATGGSDGDSSSSGGTELEPQHGNGGEDDEVARHAGGTPRSDRGVGAAVAGAGIGSSPGGPVLGTPTSPTAGGAGAGRDAPTSVASDAHGPSRSAVIGGAASAGFASADYRRVFTDYSAAIEESLDNAAVPPGRRYLVRRYFQLIRPRGP